MNVVTLILGWVLFWIVYKNPGLTATSQARLGVMLGIIVPIGAASFVVTYRLLLSPYWIYRDAVAGHSKERKQLQNELSEKDKLLDERQRHKAIRDEIASHLSVIRVLQASCNDPEEKVPIQEIDKWEAELCAYLKDNLSAADEHLFLSETGVVGAPPCKFVDERAEPLRRLHYRSHQLLKILERLTEK